MVMKVDEKVKKHKFTIDNRVAGTINGICSVEAFDKEMAILRLETEKIIIKGKELHVLRLDIDKGDIEFKGQIDSIAYQNINSAKRLATGAVKRMFK